MTKSFEITSKRTLGEAYHSLTLRTLYNNFRDVFPSSKTSNITIHATQIGEMTPTKQVVNANISGSSGSYNTSLELRRSGPSAKFSLRNPCKVKCNCAAFNYNVAYPLHQNKCLLGTPTKAAGIPNSEKNPSQIPALCKHLTVLVERLLRNGTIIY